MSHHRAAAPQFQHYSLAAWARLIGLSIRQARAAVRQERLDLLQLPDGAELQRLPSGRYRIVLPVRAPETVRTVLYARVSEASNRKHLRQQMKLLRDWAKREGAYVVDEVQEVGRPHDPSMALHELLADPTIHRIVVLGKDRIGAFSFPLLESTLRSTGRELVVLDPEWMCVRDVLREVTAMHKIMTQITEDVYARVDRRLRDDAMPELGEITDHRPHLVPPATS